MYSTFNMTNEERKARLVDGQRTRVVSSNDPNTPAGEYDVVQIDVRADTTPDGKTVKIPTFRLKPVKGARDPETPTE